METFAQDVRSGIRQFRARKGFSLLAIATLATGIGATTAIFSVVDSTMLRPLPYADPEQLVSLGISETRPDGRTANVNPSMEDLQFLRTATDLFSSVEGFGSGTGPIAYAGEPERLQTVHFTEGYLSMQGVTPMAGRDFTADDMTGRSPLVALLGYRYWQSRFNGRDVLGETIRLDDQIATIVGVLPPTFNPTTPVSLPLILTPQEFGRRGLGSRINVVARLQPDVSIGTAVERGTSKLAGWSPAGSPARPSGPARLRVTSRLDTVTRPQRTTANILLGAVGLVLLLACVNVCGLLLARGASRHAEVAVRASLGATRSRLLRQLLTESVVLAVPGAALGVLLAWLSLDLIVANVPLFVPANSPAAINVTVLLGTIGVLVPAVVVIGLLPAIRLSRVHVSGALATGTRQGSTPLTRRSGQFLIAMEIALAVVLLSGAGLMIRSFYKLWDVDLGFSPQSLVTMQVLPLERTPAAHEGYYRALIERAQTLPGVSSAAISDFFHIGTGLRTASVRGTGTDEMVAVYRVSSGYFTTIGARLVAGQWPDAREAGALARPVVINETAARLLFPDESPVGRTVMPSGRDAEPHTIAGVIADVRNGGFSGSRTVSAGHVYFPFTIAEDDLTTAMTLTVRAPDPTAELGNQLRQIAQSLGPPALVDRIASGEQLLSDGVATPRKRTVMLGLLGGLGVLHALVGIVGVTAYAVTRRTREMGVRLAFGARPSRMVLMALRDSAVPVVIGALAGVGAALYATRAIQSFLFEVSPTDPVTLALVTLGLALAGVIAALWPALRAGRIDPVASLRAE
jgi:putative ABC transport system permease protein